MYTKWIHQKFKIKSKQNLRTKIISFSLYIEINVIARFKFGRQNRMSSVKTRSWVNTTCRTRANIVVCTKTYMQTYTHRLCACVRVCVFVYSFQFRLQCEYSVSRINAIHTSAILVVLKGSSWDSAMKALWIEIIIRVRKRERVRVRWVVWVCVRAINERKNTGGVQTISFSYINGWVLAALHSECNC